MGQKGLVERVPLAHTGAVLSLDWNETGVNGGWLASAGLAADANSRTFPSGCGFRNRKFFSSSSREFGANVSTFLLQLTLTRLVRSLRPLPRSTSLPGLLVRDVRSRYFSQLTDF